jgi:hypothetical protein
MSLAVRLLKLAMKPDMVFTLVSSLDIINLVLFIFDIGCGKARVDILRSPLMLRRILCGNARYICIFERTILVKSTTDEICAIRKLGGTGTDLHGKTSGPSLLGRLHVIQ